MTTIDHGRKKPRIDIAEPTTTNHPEISTSRGRSIPAKASVSRSRAAAVGSEMVAGAAMVAVASGPAFMAATDGAADAFGGR